MFGSVHIFSQIWIRIQSQVAFIYLLLSAVFSQLLTVLRVPYVADCAFQWPVLTVLTESHAVDCVYSASCYLRLKSLTLLTLLYNAADGSYSGRCR